MSCMRPGLRRTSNKVKCRFVDFLSVAHFSWAFAVFAFDLPHTLQYGSVESAQKPPAILVADHKAEMFRESSRNFWGILSSRLEWRTWLSSCHSAAVGACIPTPSTG